MGMNTYCGGFDYATTVVIDDMVYCSSKNEPAVVAGYSIATGIWSNLPTPPVVKFGMTSLNGQLVLAGGKSGYKESCEQYYFYTVDSRITVWDSDRKEWVHPYPPMPTARTNAFAVGYHKYLIVAGGDERIDEVEVFDSSTRQWQSAEPILQEGQIMSTAIVDDRWYLYLNSGNITWVHLPTLVSCADTTRSIWQYLSPPQNPPTQALVPWGQRSVVVAAPQTPVPQVHCTLLAFRGHLLLIEGQKIHCYVKSERGCRYTTGGYKWSECNNQLPVQMGAPFLAVLPSGALLVGEGRPSHCRMWIGHAEQRY